MEVVQRWTEVQQQEVVGEQEMVRGRDESQSVFYSMTIRLVAIFLRQMLPAIAGEKEKNLTWVDQ